MWASFFYYYLFKKFQITLERTKIKLKNEYLKYTLAGFQNNMLYEKVVKKVQKHPKFLLFPHWIYI